MGLFSSRGNRDEIFHPYELKGQSGDGREQFRTMLITDINFPINDRSNMRSTAQHALLILSTDLIFEGSIQSTIVTKS